MNAMLNTATIDWDVETPVLHRRPLQQQTYVRTPPIYFHVHPAELQRFDEAGPRVYSPLIESEVPIFYKK
jgi:hypothetical protein